MRKTFALGMLAACLCSVTLTSAADWGLKEGNPEIKSAGALAFGPDGVLIVADTKGATVFAIATGDAKGEAAKVNVNIEGLGDQLAKTLGVPAAEVKVNDLAVNPETGRLFVSVSKGPAPAIVKIDETGKLSELKLDKIAFAKVTLPNPPEDKVTGQGPRARNLREDTVTDLAFVNGKVIVSGMNAPKAEGARAQTTVREIQFPFTEADQGTNLEIYHAAHGGSENYASIRTFVAMNVDGKPSLLAGFVCTPLVKIDLSTLKGEKTRGTTVAELGNMNRPLDMIAYKKDGKDYLLMANNNRGVMKISTEKLAENEGLTEPVKGGGTAGQTFETVKDLKGVVQLDKLNDDSAVILVQADGGALNLQTIKLP